MKNSNTNKIGSAKRFTHWAAVLTLAASLVIMGLFTACPNAAGGGGTSSDGNTGGGGGTPPKPRYDVSFSTLDGGSFTAQVDGNTITPGTKVQKDKTVLFTAIPDPGYKVQKWTLNGTAETYSLTLTTHVRVWVYFERDAPKYPVNFSVEGGNGTLKASFAGLVQLDTGDTIYEGDEVRFTAVPAEGYEVGIWTIEGGTFESGSGTPGYSYALVKVTAPVTVQVRFIKPADLIPLSKLNIEGTILKGFKGGENPAGILRVPADITEIADSAFYGCTGITEVHLTEIGLYAFYKCRGITKLTLSKNLTHIGYCAFGFCQMTGTLKFPASLTSVGEGAFKYCQHVALFDFRLCSNPPLTAIGTDAFEGTNSRFKVKTGTGIKALLTGSGVDAGRIDEES